MALISAVVEMEEWPRCLEISNRGTCLSQIRSDFQQWAASSCQFFAVSPESAGFLSERDPLFGLGYTILASRQLQLAGEFPIFKESDLTQLQIWLSL